MAIYPTDTDLLAVIGADNISPALQSLAAEVVAAAVAQFGAKVHPSSQPVDFPTSITDDARVWVTLMAARMLTEYGSGGVVVLNDVTLDPAAQQALLQKLEGSLFGWADPFPTLRS